MHSTWGMVRFPSMRMLSVTMAGLRRVCALLLCRHAQARFGMARISIAAISIAHVVSGCGAESTGPALQPGPPGIEILSGVGVTLSLIHI